MSNEPAPLPPLNDLPCGGKDNEQDGCQHIFIYADSSRILCFKCIKLSVPETESKGLTNEAREAARCARAAQVQLSFKTGSKPMVNVTNHVVGPSMLDTKINRMVKQINLRWTEYDGHELALLAPDSRHYELCFEDNFCIAPEASTQNIEGLYQFYANHSNCQMALGQDNAKHTKGLTRGTYMNIEVVVDSSKEEEDEESAQGKRKAGSNSHDQLIKRIKQSGNSAGTRGFTGWGCDGEPWDSCGACDGTLAKGARYGAAGGHASTSTGSDGCLQATAPLCTAEPAGRAGTRSRRRWAIQ
ncbi:hypothetical protein B0H17DRAFT_1148830 [Mycena rosella]|uniref:Uncharacterized protein n=1 Tax=Mycena rosella TaxID=1033263 RepID=A0AAD7C996_MYCRO|nr:hypothetical protein B0H17DRAFT_1148830 [Mycena rosella]